MVNIAETEILHRQKRGWFDGVGKGAHELFGIMDGDDAVHYDSEIRNLRNNENYLKDLIKNQTVIQEITSNIIRSDEQKTRKQLDYLKSSIAELQQKDVAGEMQLFNTISMETLSTIITYRETQNTIIGMLTTIFHGKIPPSIITPNQLKQQLEIINKHISLMIPGDAMSGHISQLC